MNDNTTPHSANASPVRHRWRASRFGQIAGVGALAALAIAAILWAAIGVTYVDDAATAPIGQSETAMAVAEPGAVDEKTRPDDRDPEMDGKSIDEEASMESARLPNRFERDADLIVQQMRAEVFTMLAAPQQNGSLTPSVAVLRDRTAALRSMSVPRNIAEQWTATLVEIDGWTALLESGDRAEADDQRHQALSALDRLALTLSSLTTIAR